MRSFTLLNVAKPFLLACNEPSRCFPKIPKIGATTMNNNKKRVLPLRCKSFWLSSNGDWLEVPKEIDNEEEFIVVNFYRFVFIEDPEEEVSKHLSFLEGRDIHGRIYLNKQGINAQYSGPNKDALAYVKWVREDCRFSDVLVQISPASNGHAFPRLKLRYKPSLVQHFQRDIVRGVEGYISTSKKQVEIARKLVDNCYKYGSEIQNGPSTLPKVAVEFGTSHAAMEDQREIMLGVLGSQVCEPLRASIHGAPLEDARHLTHSYDRMRQEFESQATEVIRRQSKFREASTESLAKLKNAETRLSELKSSVLVLGKEATDAMLSVEEEQQQITFQKLLTMVDAERSYHQNVVSILEKLHSEMLVEEQLSESSPQSSNSPRVLHDTTSNGTEHPAAEDKSPTYFIAKVMHSFDAQADGELSLEVGDYAVVRQVAPNGWSEGECNGKSGWFPSAYAVKSDEVVASKMLETDTTP